MQVLNSPSRSEVDRVHSRGSWMGIGIPSVRNAFRVSKFKTGCWIMLLLSSIPLHLLFNSLVFQTDQRDSEYGMALVSESFLDDVPFYLPGASLTPSNWLYYGDELSIDLTEYTDHQSAIWQTTFTMATDGSRWDNISVNECYNEYFAVSQLSRILILGCQASPNIKTSWLRLIGVSLPQSRNTADIYPLITWK